MRFFISQPELARMSALVQRAASSRDTVPFLSGMLIKASPSSGLSLTCTDLEISINATTTQVDVAEEGTVLVNARYFTDLVRYLPNTELQVYTDEERSRLTVTYGRSKTDLHLYNPQEFPEAGYQETQPLLSVSHQGLKDILRKTSFAAAVSHFKQVFTGVLFDLSPEQLRLVASDTHRLALMSVAIKANSDDNKQFVIPARTANELIRVLDDSEEEVVLSLSGNTVLFTSQEPNFRLVSRLLEGQYPNYLPVIPTAFIATVTVDPGLLASALERAVLMPAERQNNKQAIRHVTLDIKDGELSVYAYSQKMGELKEILEDAVVEGENDIKISFNTRYLLDVIRVLQGECDSICLKLTGSLSPAVIQVPSQEDYTYVLVPVITQ